MLPVRRLPHSYRPRSVGRLDVRRFHRSGGELEPEAHGDERDDEGHALVVRNGKGRTRKRRDAAEVGSAVSVLLVRPHQFVEAR